MKAFFQKVLATFVMVLAVACIFGLFLAYQYARATVVPAGQFGNIQLAAATATKVPAAPLNPRSGILIQNLGTTDMYCGTANTVTAANGIKVSAGGGTFKGNAAWDTVSVQYWCYSTLVQASPADTRWMEVASSTP